LKLEFLGTRGYIDARTRRHARHTTLKVSYYGRAVAIDCGEDWLGLVDDWDVGAIVVTHAHPDHAWGLKEGAPCPVYATAEAWETMDGYDLAEREVLVPRQPTEIEGLTFEAFPVDHSTRAPAVGYRITAGAVTVFYVPDVVWIRDREAALSGAQVYVGDGATMRRSMVRKIEGALIGHTPVRTQLTWCKKEGVPRAIITHCGGEIVEGDERTLGAEIRQLAEERGIEARIAYDGLEVVLR
jgi:phosphoribosyl 1,2-cyclic phosphodiesterase